MGIRPRVANDAVLLFMNELTARIVAQSGRPEDRFHIGKQLLQSFKDAPPDFLMQIDGATGESVTFKQGLERSVRCAIAFRNMGLKTGDVMVLMSPNYSDLAAAFYAALYLGVIIAPVDMSLGVLELTSAFEMKHPKIVFCKSDKVSDATKALAAAQEKALIVTFDKGEQEMSFAEFIKKYSDDSPIEDFKPNDFDPDAVAMLVATSGTTGLPKAAGCSHKNLSIVMPYIWSRFTTFPTPTRVAMVCTTLQWMTALVNYLGSPIMRYTRLHSSEPMTREHAYYLINNFKPTYTIISPTLLVQLINPATRDQCDFSSFEVILTGGSVVHQELLDEVQKVMPSTETSIVYGMSELSGIGFHPEFPSRGTCGKPVGCFQYRIVDLDTQEEIIEPNKRGELWVKGPAIISGYYNNPEATKAAFTEDRWFKTGDLFYRDEHWNFYFVERIKLLLKYKNYQISPVEVEGVILQHPGVRDAVVVGIPELESGELPVAFIIPRPGSNVTAQEIKDLVKSSLSDAKQLRGGVIFLDAFPVTATSKVNRMKLKEMALTMPRQ